ncbi:hypothetical protein EDB92DRAFT_108146 [Lactarius akahatsu]|uniref:Uncharacterized protein n=1 Tax=Lactarius akahatsu TaxID=416441 RepID=A0AAD4QFR7_9AGAM|nr:hypothetical protein EDB92DRAFT_108146 [Lactarius akahatsu]
MASLATFSARSISGQLPTLKGTNQLSSSDAYGHLVPIPSEREIDQPLRYILLLHQRCDSLVYANHPSVPAPLPSAPRPSGKRTRRGVVASLQSVRERTPSPHIARRLVVGKAEARETQAGGEHGTTRGVPTRDKALPPGLGPFTNLCGKVRCTSSGASRSATERAFGVDQQVRPGHSAGSKLHGHIKHRPLQNPSKKATCNRSSRHRRWIYYK